MRAAAKKAKRQMIDDLRLQGYPTPTLRYQTGLTVECSQRLRTNQRNETAMTHALLNDSRHWRDRAEEMLLLAEEMSCPEARQMMIRTAMGYERLAAKAELRTELARKNPHG